jgi:Rhodopirellula transposase DDE domain
MSDAVESLASRFEVLKPHLNERQRRLWLGAEARELGSGGVGIVAQAVGVAGDTVRRGRAELEEPQALPYPRSRKPGGGRKRAEEGDPGLVAALDKLVDPVTRGDPMSPLRWTSKSLRTLAKALQEQGHHVSEQIVRRLLREAGYSLQANAKTLEGGQHPDRDAQFIYLAGQAAEHLAAGAPVVSVDAKKKELVGQFKNGGQDYRPAGSPVPVNVHDFLDPALGKAIPYGVYDIGANSGWVSVGSDHDTAAFAVATLRNWWDHEGHAAYPHTDRLLITADGGGSNGTRLRAWKSELAAFAATTGLHITVCHLPPGTSKWNKIEHRLFSHITMNWRGTPLTSHQVVVNLIGAVTTSTGLRVHAELDEREYPTGIRISDAEMDALPINRHDWHGDWNYTMHPDDTPDTH